MRSHVILAVFKRNVQSYFSGVLGYLFIVVFVVAAAALAYSPQFFANNVASLDQLNEYFPLLLLFIIPAITMSAWADERRQGTEELLFTLPAKDTEILLGKYLSVLAVYTVALLFSALQLAVLAYYADPDWGLITTNYLGYWFSGAALLSAGMVASSLTSSVTVAFILGVAVCAVPVFLGAIPGVVEFVPFLRELSLDYQLREFSMGIIPLSGLVYFATLTAFMLYLNLVVIRKRHWSGDQTANMGLQYAVRTACLLVVLASLNLISRTSADALNLYADATADDVYTLSATTRDLLRSVEEDRPVLIQAFFSEDVPRDYVALRKRLTGLLRQYDRLGGRAVTVRIVATEPFSKAAEEAQSYGIEKRQLQTERGGRYELAEFYLGAVVRGAHDEVVIPAFDLDTPIEYELTRSVRTVSGKTRRTVGVLQTDLRVMGGFSMTAMHGLPNWKIVDELKKQYAVVGISPDSPYDEQSDLKLFSIDAKETRHAESLNGGKLPDELRTEYARKDIELTSDASVKVVAPDAKWRVVDEKGDHESTIVKSGDELTVYRSLDALVAPLPSSLTQMQMPRFVEAVESGLPTLIFDDPLPVVDVRQAPMSPKPRPGGMFGGGQPPEPKADDGMARSLMRVLGIRWDGLRRETFALPPDYASELDGGEITPALRRDFEGAKIRLSPGARIDTLQRGSRWRIEDERDRTITIVRKGPVLVATFEAPELVVVWDRFNPHPKIDDERILPPELVFVTRQSGIANALDPDSPITKGLKQVLAPFPGRIEPVRGAGTKFEALLYTSRDSGEMVWSQIVDEERSVMGPQFRNVRSWPHYSDEDAHALAARIRARDGDGVNVVYVADVDFISDMSLFDLADNLRRSEYKYDLRLDNLQFVLNAIDLLAGDEENIELRRRRTSTRPLAGIQSEIEAFRRQRQEAEEEALTKLEEELDKLQDRLREARRKINQDSELDIFSQAQQLYTAAEREERNLNRRQEEIEKERQRTIDRLKGQERSKVSGLETRIRWQAVMLPPLPAILLGMLVLGVRLHRERSEIPSDRAV